MTFVQNVPYIRYFVQFNPLHKKYRTYGTFPKNFMFSTNQTASHILFYSLATHLYKYYQTYGIIPVLCYQIYITLHMLLHSTFDQSRHHKTHNTMPCLKYRTYGTFLSKHHKTIHNISVFRWDNLPKIPYVRYLLYLHTTLSTV